MVAAQHEPLQREPDALGELLDQGPEAGGSQPGVAAELVDLVRGRLDEHRRPVVPALEQGCLDHERVGRAHRGDAGRPAAVLRVHDGVQSVAHAAQLPRAFDARNCSFRPR